eukprot:366168-Chlamydomonas_euryale.AAC.5
MDNAQAHHAGPHLYALATSDPSELQVRPQVHWHADAPLKLALGPEAFKRHVQAGSKRHACWHVVASSFAFLKSRHQRLFSLPHLPGVKQ